MHVPGMRAVIRRERGMRVRGESSIGVQGHRYVTMTKTSRYFIHCLLLVVLVLDIPCCVSVAQIPSHAGVEVNKRTTHNLNPSLSLSLPAKGSSLTQLEWEKSRIDCNVKSASLFSHTTHSSSHVLISSFSPSHFNDQQSTGSILLSRSCLFITIS